MKKYFLFNVLKVNKKIKETINNTKKTNTFFTHVRNRHNLWISRNLKRNEDVKLNSWFSGM